MDRRSFAILTLAAVAAPGANAVAKDAPTEWDGLVRVKSKKLRYVYLRPGADFRAYTAVQLEPPEVEFDKDWMRNVNSTSLGRTNRITDSDAQKAADMARTGFQEILVKAYT